MNNSKERRALVTGAGGFIGSHLVEGLVRGGWLVRSMVRYSSDGGTGFLSRIPAGLADRVEIRRGDLLDSEFVTGCCENVDTVFHLGARIAIPYSYHAPRDVLQVNTVGTLNVLEGVRRAGVRRLVHTSTSEVYGSAVTVPMPETHRLRAQSPYAASKIAADKLVESYVCAFGVPAVTVRPFNTYGPRQSTRAVIPTIIEQCLKGGPIRLGSLWPRRDFTFVTDTVRGFLCAAAAEAVGQEINLGCGQDISIGDLVGRIQALLGTSCEVMVEDQRIRPPDSEVCTLQSDNSRAKAVLGWDIQVDLDEGLRQTIEWWRQSDPRFSKSSR